MLRALLVERDREKQRAEEQKQRAETQAKRAEELQVENLRLQMELERFRKWYYSPRADRLRSPGDLAQVLLDFAEELERKPIPPDEVPPQTEPEHELRRVQRRCGRRALANFDSLPVTTKVYESSPEQRACPCCGMARQGIGADESWQVDYMPGHFEHWQHVRKKYACPGCARAGENPRIEVAAKPEAATDKGLAGPGLLAYIVTSKFSDYLPLYRLEDIFERQGFEISRATQSVWCGDVADLVEPLYERMAGLVRQSHVVATDDTIMPVQSAGKAQSAPVLAELRQRLLTWKEQLLPKHPMAEAVSYTLSQWAELNVFCSDKAVLIDNNGSEREMKRVVLNRKNSLFVNNPRGGRTAAILASLTSTCRRHGIDPQLYLTQLLVTLPQLRTSELPAWLPDPWKLHQAARQASLHSTDSPAS
jgi:transposase